MLISLLASCRSATTGEKGVVEMHITGSAVSSLPADELFSRIDYISLRFEEDRPVGSVGKVVIKDGTLFLSDGRRVFQYSVDGEYIGALERRGRGPQEYSGIMDFAVDSSHIYLIDRNMKLLKYTLENDFVRGEKLDFFPASIYVDQGKILLTSAYQNEGDKFCLYDAATLQRERSFQPILKAEMNYRHIMGQSNFYTYNGRLLYHEPMNNSVYSLDLENCTYTETYRFDLNGHNPPAEFWNQTYANVVEINMTAAERGYSFGLPVFAMTDQYMLFTYRDGDAYRMCLYDRRKGTSRSFDALQFDEKMPAVPVADILFCFSDGKSLCMVLPENFFFDAEGYAYVEGLLPEDTGNGNPVVVMLGL